MGVGGRRFEWASAEGECMIWDWDWVGESFIYSERQEGGNVCSAMILVLSFHIVLHRSLLSNVSYSHIASHIVA